MPTASDLVFLLDVDNTLLDNDRFGADLRAHLEKNFGAEQCERYWSLYERLRDEAGYADYLATLQAFRKGLEGRPELLQVSAFLLEYPFAERLYPGTLEGIAYLRTLGLPVVLSDGDMVFQPRKVQRSGIWEAVEGRVLITLRKEYSLDLVQQRFPATHYVMLDDKPQLLAAMKSALGEKLTTIFVRQGHYAEDATDAAIAPAPDLCIDRIGVLLDLDRSHFRAARPAQTH